MIIYIVFKRVCKDTQQIIENIRIYNLLKISKRTHSDRFDYANYQILFPLLIGIELDTAILICRKK